MKVGWWWLLMGAVMVLGEEEERSQSSYLLERSSIDFVYHDYESMTKFLRTTSSKHPNLTALYSIGKSVQGTVEQYYPPLTNRFSLREEH